MARYTGAKNRPNQPNMGATAIKSAKVLITHKPLVVDSILTFLGLGKLKNPPVIWGLGGPIFPQNLVISETYFCELVLGFSPDRNQTTAEIFSGKLKFRLRFTVGPQNVRKSRANFTTKAITRERKEISSPNSVHMFMSIIFGQIKKSGSTTWWRYKIEKTYKQL